jgi:hypothetical protein
MIVEDGRRRILKKKMLCIVGPAGEMRRDDEVGM